MNPERLAELFQDASAIADAQARRDFVARETADDEALRQELESLLTAHDAAGDFLEESAVAEAAALVPSLLGSNLVGSSIGAWRIDSLIHGGGMGSVFRATRIGDDFVQNGALKLVSVGFETEELIRRFSSERQLLARVDHPHIARLLDGGTTDDGLPWLAMEYVDGLAIDVYAQHQRLTISERLDLFDQLADAIAYLHENLITHRDIKASNVLVDSAARVRVLDFGIANLLEEAGMSAEATVERRLSVATAAPEQLSSGAISTATDVYSLGVLLYTLLSGVPPYRIHGAMSLREIEITICEEVPLRASYALQKSEAAAEHAATCRTGPARLAGELRGDLDTILARALHKDPGRRYRTVAELREDIERYRGNRPIEARADSAAYRSGKFLRRHWLGVSATTAVMLSLVTGLTLALWQAEEAARQRDRAQAMNEFMQEVLVEADPYEAGADKRVRDVLTEASALLETRFEGQPLLEASLRQSVGGVQLSLFELNAGEINLRRAMDLLEANAPPDDETRLRTEANLAWLAHERENPEQAVALYEATIARLTEDHDPELRALIHNDLGVVLSEWGRYAESIPHQERAMALSPDSPDRLATLVNLGYAHDGLGNLEEAKRYYLEVIERLRAQGDRGVVADLGHALNNYGNVLSQEGRDEEALPYYLESLEVRYRVSGPDSDSVAAQHLNVGRLLLDMDRPGDARHHLDAAVRIFPRYRDADSIYTRVARMSLARAVLQTSRNQTERQAAVTVLREVLAALQADEDYSASRFVDQASEWLASADLPPGGQNVRSSSRSDQKSASPHR